ncbi:glycoside hydrolase family 3 N-terminal domain-containing protein [Arthrobacter sp.]|uniref:beta-glucosidase family protein n=2 Tax=Arthrobacter sp. TaxID=1667 RepID=UPI00281274E1|nr:glycoside hydrolase family 3 N-terminal domain-containing protein [Arthrobacter sp.]
MTGRSSRRRKFIALAVALPLALSAAGLGSIGAASAETQATAADLPWMNTALTPQERSALLLKALTLDQKLQQLSGARPEILPDLPECYGGRHVTGIAELGIPTLRITNGPVGVGQNDCVDPALFGDPNAPSGTPYVHTSSAKATALPSGTTVAASFDPENAAAFGGVIADEMNNLALHVFEAPGLNMARLPVLGRNFEYFGEDPYLTGTMGVAEIEAVQDKGIIAMAKHYAANEQETNRKTIQETVDERTLHEMYLLPFEMAVKDGDVASLMCAYNYVNGVSSCENDYLLNDVLRDQWGFEGYVQSDFFATKSTADTLRNGMDHMMPVPQQWEPQLLKAALESGEINISHIDTALDRRYVQMFKYGIFDRPLVQTPIDYAAGGESARKIGVDGGVLLQNNGALPIKSTVDDVLVIGKASQVYAQQAVAGGAIAGKPAGSDGRGSSVVVPTYEIAPVEGIENVLANLGNTSANVRLALVDDANETATVDGEEVAFAEVLEEAKDAEAVVMMAGTISTEGADRATFTDSSGKNLVEVGNNLDWYVDNLAAVATVDGPNKAKNSNTVAMIKAVMGAAPAMNDKTTLVLKDNAGVEMDPALVGEQGPAILEAWFPGQEDGHIVADLLLGVENPSGKSPVTFPYAGKGFLDHATDRQFPGEMVNNQQTVEYTEKLNVGYRWYDANESGECEQAADGSNPCVAFPFGHGLSYTDFEISKLKVTSKVSDGTKPIKVQFFVENTGDAAGAEVPQIYVSMPESAGEPPKRLVGFDKVELEPGEKKRIEITIDPSASNHPLSYWDADADTWVTPEGKFDILVGDSSGSTTLSDSVTVRTPAGHKR